jgi:pilus assembly protein CpaD
MSQRAPLAFIAGLGLAASLAACATSAEPPPGPPSPTYADQHRIGVEQTGERFDIAVSAADVALSAEARSSLVSFGRAYRALGHGPLVMSAPSGGSNADAAARVAQETRMVLVEAGVPFAAIAGSTYDASGTDAAPVVVSFSRYEAVAPDCRPLWEQDLMANRHRPYESFGCANNANLAAMIEDPHDLLAPRDETPRDAARRAAVLELYRTGQSTHAARSSDERVAISDAVE